MRGPQIRPLCCQSGLTHKEGEGVAVELGSERERGRGAGVGRQAGPLLARAQQRRVGRAGLHPGARPKTGKKKKITRKAFLFSKAGNFD